MSMISAQCDELRKAASKFGGYQNGDISRLLHDAADTISELRDDLQRANAENAKLRELLADVFRDFVSCDLTLREHGRTFLAYTRYVDRMRELRVEVEP